MSAAVTVERDCAAARWQLLRVMSGAQGTTVALVRHRRPPTLLVAAVPPHRDASPVALLGSRIGPCGLAQGEGFRGLVDGREASCDRLCALSDAAGVSDVGQP